MKRLVLLLAVMGLAFCLLGGQAWGDDFFVVAGGGPSGKVLKTQVFTSNSQDSTLGTSNWAKLSAPQWTYSKVSSTSHLVITYQDILARTGGADSVSVYQLRVNDQPSAAGQYAAMLICNTNINGTYGATGVWPGLPKGDLNLSIWHFQQGCTNCWQNAGVCTTSVLVMEIEQ